MLFQMQERNNGYVERSIIGRTVVLIGFLVEIILYLVGNTLKYKYLQKSFKHVHGKKS